MNPLTIKQVKQIAKEYNVNFEIDEKYQFPIISHEGIVLRPSIQYDDKHDGWKMSDNKRKTAGQLSKMVEIKNLLNGEGISE